MPLFDDEPTLGVGEVVERVRRVVASAFPAEVWVRGEVQGLKAANANGHVYFDLCERNNRRGPATTMPAALLRADRARVDRALAAYPSFRLADGVEVRVRGKVQYGYGRVSLLVSAIDPVHTLGKLAADRERVLAALAADGVLDAQQRVPVPLVPLRIGLVTSVGSAAYEDVVQELRGSGIGFTVVAADARTQGAGAELAMVQALHRLRREGVDVVLLVRGGGARTDLVAFDGERLARTITAMPVPVLAGVGHEIDTTVVDAVAHMAYKTPTAAAAAVCDRVRRAHERAETAWRRVAPAVLAVPDRAEARVAAAATRLVRVARSALDRPAARLDLLEAKVAAHDPSVLLARGWSLTHTADGRLVRSADDAPPGTELVTTVQAGELRSRVT